MIDLINNAEHSSPSFAPIMAPLLEDMGALFSIGHKFNKR